MFCNQCGAELPEGASFCNQCGAKRVDIEAPENAAPSESAGARRRSSLKEILGNPEDHILV
jgi:uncharacterized membrane protein YvbJ